MEKARVIAGKRKLIDVDVADVGAPPAGYVIVQVSACGICGSDVEAFKEGHFYFPMLSGHEYTGTIVAVGAGVQGFSPGDRVARVSQPACADCAMCRRGLYENCLNTLGLDSEALKHGAYARYVPAPARGVLKLPKGMCDEDAALIEPATVALHAVRRQQPRLGDCAVLIGAGAVGLFVAQLVRLAGATRVVVIDPKPARRERAIKLGVDGAFAPDDPEAEARIKSFTDGRGADLAFDCAGRGATIELAASLLRPGGKVMVVGVPNQPVQLSPHNWLIKEIDVRTSLAHTRAEFDITLDLLARSLLRTTGIVDRIIPLAELEDTLGSLADGRDDAIKVLVAPSL